MTFTAAELKRLKHTEDPANIQRMGQWFLNKYFPLDTNPDLFYEVNTDKAVSMILGNYSLPEQK